MSRILLSIVLFLGCVSPALAGPVKPGPSARCAVCGMKVAPYPNWLAIVVFRDGTQAFFDGPKDMFVYLADLQSYRPRGTREEIAAIYVTEYYTTRLIAAGEALFVGGSDILGPMGSEFVPVQGLANARTLAKEHGGKNILQFDGIKLTEIAAGE